MTEMVGPNRYCNQCEYMWFAKDEPDRCPRCSSFRWKEGSKPGKDLSQLSPQLIGLEGWRVEVITTYGEKRRFYVGISSGRRPIHLEVATRRSLGGYSAESHYQSVKKLYKR